MSHDKNISVCHLASGDLWAGAEVQIHNLLCGLKDQGLEVSAIIFNNGTLATKLKECGIKVFVLEESRQNFFSLLLATNAIVKELSPNILHSHRYKENIIASFIKLLRRNIILVQTIHGLGEPFTGLRKIKTSFFRLINNLLTRISFSVIITVSEDISRRLRNNFQNQHLKVIHNSVTLNSEKELIDAIAIKKQLAIPIDSTVIGSVGRLTSVKNFELLLTATKTVFSTDNRCVLILVGDGEQKKFLIDLSKQLGIENKVIFTGFREDVKGIVSCFDIFAVSSLHEGIPTALLEAMYLEKAVVCTNVGGIAEIVTNNQTGILVPSNNPQALAQACLDLLGDESKRITLGRNAKQQVIDNFSLRNQLASHLEIYRELRN
jgi:glycosyltransferase involved in cell wall biosynthesis